MKPYSNGEVLTSPSHLHFVCTKKKKKKKNSFVISYFYDECVQHKSFFFFNPFYPHIASVKSGGTAMYRWSEAQGDGGLFPGCTRVYPQIVCYTGLHTRVHRPCMASSSFINQKTNAWHRDSYLHANLCAAVLVPSWLESWPLQKQIICSFEGSSKLSQATRDVVFFFCLPAESSRVGLNQKWVKWT